MNANIPSRFREQSNESRTNWNVLPHFIIDYKKLVADFVRFWWLFLVIVILALSIVQIKHRYTQPIYRASLSILMDERGAETPQNDMMEGFGLSSAMRAIENQIAILRSWETVRQTINELDFHLSYFRVGRVKNTEIYGNLPFRVHFDSLSPQLLNTPVYLSIIDQYRFRLHVNTENAGTFVYFNDRNGQYTGRIDFTGEYRFNEWVKLPWMNIMIDNKALSQPEERAFYFQFHHPEILTSQYQSLLHVPKPANNASIIRMSITGPNTSKNLAFLNTLAKVFIRNNLEQKNQIATNTIYFIEHQLAVISDSLSTKGDELSRFRTANQIQSIPDQAGNYFSRLEILNDKQTRLLLKLSYFDYLAEYFGNDTLPVEIVAPAFFPVDIPQVEAQVSRLVTLNLERMTISHSANPYLTEINNQVEASRLTLLQILENQKILVNEEITRLEIERLQIRDQLAKLPGKERQLLDIERHFGLSNEVYTFLLRKRSEAQIQKASNTADHTVLEAARPAGLVSPSIGKERQRAALIALILPVILILGKHLANNKISSSEDVEKLTKVPITGHIIHSKKEESNVVHHYPKSLITENFRKVRTRLDFLTSLKEIPIIAISSSMPGEGKTFCAVNIASIYAISGKKTILLGFDLRKPGLNKVLPINNTNGISNYLIGKIGLDDAIQPTPIENLHVMSSGPIPPNPAELISAPVTKQLFAELKKRFEVILVDTPPMDVVADGFLLAKHVDHLVFLVRQNYTIRSVFWHTMKQMQEEGLNNTGILINDLQSRNGTLGYKYGYKHGKEYGYEYGYGYHED